MTTTETTQPPVADVVDVPPVKTFRASKRGRERTPYEFDLTWYDDDGEEGGTERFTVIPSRISEVTLMEAPNMRITNESTAFFRLFEQAMGAEEYERFHDFVTDSDHNVEAENLTEIIQWMVEITTGRPTGQPRR